VYLDPLDVEAWAHAVVSLLEDPDRLECLRLRGVARAAAFSWTDSAETLWAAYRALPARRAA
jgi:glycosyltransferase involved in cell wall biosynthesis